MTEQRHDVLVVGYGNDLRSDDAVGRRSAEAVAACNLPGVRALSVPQLVPELTTELSGCRCAIFVDASVVDQVVRERPVTAESGDLRLTHHATPEALLALAAVVDYPPTGRPPAEVLVLSIPATRLELGAELSPEADAALPQAVERIVAICSERS